MRKLGVFLIGFGAFLVVIAGMLRFYAYPQVAKAPADQDSVATLVGPGATVFDIATLKEITTDLTTTAKTVGDVQSAKDAGGNTVVWVTTSSTKSSDGVVRGADVEREAFNAASAEAVNCCGEFISNTQGQRTPIKHAGLLVKFPFQTQKKTYDFWDGSLGKATPIAYKGTTSIDGVTVYTFAQTIPVTKVGTTDVPASLIGVSGSGNVTTDEMYSNERTLWVEPETGVIIKRQEKQDNTLDYQGTPKITTTKVTTGYDAKTVKDNADTYGSLGSQLHLIRAVLPPVSLVLGLLLLVAGFVVSRRQPAARGSGGHAA